MRSMQTGSLSMGMAGEWAVTPALTLLFLAVTSVMFRVIERQVRVEGALGTLLVSLYNPAIAYRVQDEGLAP